jgi:ribosomal protein L22
MADEKDTPEVDEAVTEVEQTEATGAEATEVEPTEEKPKRARAKKPATAAEKADVPAEKAKPARAKRPAAGERALVRAQAKYVRTSARKARLVCDHIRGKSVSEARAILAHAPRAVARDWSKLLESAVANAENNHELIGDELRIAAVTADEGPTLKRFRPRAMGRATKIRKRTSHLTITLTPKE